MSATTIGSTGADKTPFLLMDEQVVEDAVERAIRKAASRIRGVSVQFVSVDTASYGTSVRAEIQGWGMCLHSHAFEIDFDVMRAAFGRNLERLGLDARSSRAASRQVDVEELGAVERDRLRGMDLDEMIDVVMHVLKPIIETQKTRAAHASRSGVRNPIEDGHDTLSHVLVDPRLARIAIGRCGADSLREETLARLDKLRDLEFDHQRDDEGPVLTAYDGESAYDNMDMLLDTSSGVPILSWQEVIATGPDDSGHFDHLATVVFDGASLSLAQHLPDSVVNAAKGRRIGEIVRTGRKEIDDAVVTDVASSGEECNFPTVLRTPSTPTRLDRLLNARPKA